MRPEIVSDAPTRAWNTGTTGHGAEETERAGDGARESQDEPVQPGDRIDHFKIVRPLGAGGMGAVYLARDTRLGRRVALKLLRPEAIGAPEIVERFVHEARTTARFSHPHIVTIHHVGEYGDHPYLALEYLDGQSLRERLRQSRFGVSESIRTVVAIADALREAHAHGVLHRDLKPANVMLPRDGRLRVVDFGLAKWIPRPATLGADASMSLDVQAVDAFESQEAVLRGTPAYMAPEQWTASALSPATDIWALGLILYELLTGQHPYQGRRATSIGMAVIGPEPVALPRIDAPPELLDLLEQCLNKNGEDRPDTGSVVDRLESMLSRPRPRADIEDTPFRGLLPWEESDAGRFYGRDGELAAFIERLREEPILPVVGPSGAGKSSFVRAGVLPRLREQGRWTMLPLRPGARPLRAMAARLLRGGSRGTTRQDLASTAELATRMAGSGLGPRLAAEEVDAAERSLTERLRRSTSALALDLLELAEREGSRVLLLVDQAEELFTLERDPEQRRLFLEAVCRAADDPAGPVRVVLTLRDDFLGHLAETPSAREALARVVVLRTPGADALREILHKPVRALGYEYDDPSLVDEMVDDVEGEPAALPLLQMAGQSLWERRDRDARRLRRIDYEAVGRVAGALARHADGILEGLPPDQIRLARQLLLRLVSPEGTRRVVTLGPLLEGLDPTAPRVLDRLIQGRLVVARGGRGGGLEEADVELVHESLIRSWHRLARWMEEGREELAFLADAGEAARLWERRGRRAEEAWSGEALSDALRRARRVEALPGAIRDFLDAGHRQEQRRVRMRRGAITALVAGLAAVATVTGLFALEASRQRDEAEARSAQALQEGAAASFARGDLLAARSKLRGALQLRDDPAARMMWQRMAGDPRLWSTPFGQHLLSARFSPDGSTVAVAGEGRTLQLLDARTGTVRSTLRGTQENVNALAFSPDGARLFSAAHDGAIQEWDTATAESLRTLEGHVALINDLDVDPSGRWLASASLDHTLGIWDLATGAFVHRLETPGVEVTGARFDGDGERLVSGGADGSLRVWSAATGEEVGAWRVSEARVASVAFTADGTGVLAVAYDDTLSLLDAATGERRRLVEGLAPKPRSLDVHPDGRRVVTASRDGELQVWDVVAGAAVASRRAHGTRIVRTALSPDGSRAVTVSYDRSVKLWDLVSLGLDTPVSARPETVWMAAFSPDGRTIAASGRSTTLRSADTGELIWEREYGSVISQLFTPDGAKLVQLAMDGRVRIVDAQSSAVIREIRPSEGGVRNLDLAADGRSLVLCGESWVGAWDLETGRPIGSARPHPWTNGAFALLPDGKGLVTVDARGGYHEWSWPELEYRRQLAHAMAPVVAFAASRDGKRALGVSLVPRAAEIVSLEDGTAVRVALPEGVAPYHGGFSPDGSLAALAASDGRVYVVDSGGTVVATLDGARDETTQALFDPSGRRIVASSEDGTVRVWNVATARPLWWAPALLGDPVELHSQAGRQRLAGDGEGEASRAGAWQEAVATARRADQSPGGELVCLADHGGGIQAWRVGGEAPLWTRDDVDAPSVRARDDSCVVLDSAGDVRRIGVDGNERILHDAASAVAVDGETTWVASGRQIVAVGMDGAITHRLPAGRGVSAIARVGDELFVGYADGALDRVPLAEAGDPSPPFTGLPGVAVVELLPGPGETLAAGFEDGFVGLWSLDRGDLLQPLQLHGPAVHLRFGGDQLFAASELGAHGQIDLSGLSRTYCDLLHEVWERVPTVWDDGRVVVTPRPPDHPCAR